MTTHHPELFGIIDLGSNSVRMSIYEGRVRAPQLIFEEGHLTELGRDLDVTGNLWPKGVETLFAALSRFDKISRDLKVIPHILATEALRLSPQGAQILEDIHRRFPFQTQLLTGTQELEMGVETIRYAFGNVSGYIADFGGGSMEVGLMKSGKLVVGTSLPLGAHRLMKQKNGGDLSYDQACQFIEATLQTQSKNLAPYMKGSYPLYLMGGAARTLGHLFMQSQKYPLPLIHGFSPLPKALERFCENISHMTEDELEDLAIRKRKRTLPRSALAIQKLLEFINPESVIYCACGIREGYLMSLLSPEEQDKDPVLEVSKKLHPNPEFAARLCQKLRLFFHEVPDSYIDWSAYSIYPKYPFQNHLQAEALAHELLGRTEPGLLHEDRAFLATVAYVFIHEESPPSMSRGTWAALSVLEKGMKRQATAMGFLIRFFYDVTGGSVDLLEQIRIHPQKRLLDITLPADLFLRETACNNLRRGTQILKIPTTII